MGRPYSAKTRAQAATMADLFASNVCDWDDLERFVGAPQAGSPYMLVAKCRDAVDEELMVRKVPLEAVYAHVAALLREGWSPGDPIEFLPRPESPFNGIDRSVAPSTLANEEEPEPYNEVSCTVEGNALVCRRVEPENATGAADAMTPEGPGEYDPEEEAYAEGRRRDAEAFAGAEEDDELDRVTDPEPEDEENLFDTSDAEDYDEDVTDPDPDAPENIDEEN